MDDAFGMARRWMAPHAARDSRSIDKSKEVPLPKGKGRDASVQFGNHYQHRPVVAGVSQHPGLRIAARQGAVALLDTRRHSEIGAIAHIAGLVAQYERH